MAIKFVDSLPTARRGTPAISDDDVKALKDKPATWALVAESTGNPAKFSTWVNDNEGFVYQTRTVKTEKYTNSKGAEATRRFVDVYVAYDPQGKLKS